MRLALRAPRAPGAVARLGATLALVATSCLAVALVWALVGFPAQTLTDVDQGRVDSASRPLDGSRTLGQTFRSRRANLSAIEFWAVVYDAEAPLPAGARMRLTLERLGEGGVGPEPVREVWVDLSGLRHNERLRVAFTPLADSAGVAYRATVWTPEDYGLALWRTDTDAYAPGGLLEGGAPAPGDLSMTTHYTYGPVDALRHLASRAGAAALLLPGLLLLLPGYALALWLPADRRWDGWTSLALVLALAIAFWALLALWAGTLGVNAGGPRARVVLGGMGALAAVALARGRRVFLPAGNTSGDGDARTVHVAMVVVLALAVAGRALNVRDLVVPNWVDSLHHTLIARLISEAGGVPATYEPYLPVENLHYHFGLHAAAAGLTWILPLRADEAVLLLGQALSALAPLAAYTLAGWLFRRRWAGVGAALVAGSLSYMPAYYASWGRYTQLAGLVVLPAACLAACRTLERDGFRHAPTAALLSAGLALTHYRVLLLYVFAWPLVILWRGLAARHWREAARAAARALAVGGAALALIAPWAWRFARQVLPEVGSAYGGWAASEAAGGLSTGLLEAYWFLPLLEVAAAGLAWGIARRRGAALFLGAWVGMWFLAANLHVVGLRDIWLLDADAVVISLWLPVGALCGYLVADATGVSVAGLRRRWPGRPWGTWRAAALLAATLALGAAGAWAHVDIVNPVTVLVTEEDLRAMAWVREHTPPDALFLVNSRGWQGDIRMGSDAGWWLPMLADRRATQPAVLYHHGTPEYREAVCDLSLAVERAERPDEPALLARLEAEGVTHVFVGAKGGTLLPRDLDPSPHYRTVYADGPVRVYEFLP